MAKIFKNPFVYIIFMLILFAGMLIYEVSIVNAKVTLENGCDNKKASFIAYKVEDSWHKITFCDNFDNDIITIKSEYFPLNQYISFDYIGNPNGPKTELYLEDKYGETYQIPNLSMIAHGWRNVLVKVPSYLRDSIRLVAVDAAVKTNGWIGIGGIEYANTPFLQKIPIFLKTFLFIVIFTLFISAIYVFFLKRHTQLQAYVYMSLFVGISSVVSFGLYLYSVKIGKYFSVILLLWALYSVIVMEEKHKNPFLLLYGILFSLMMIILFVGYVNVEDLHNLQAVSANRWHHLPVDNWIPKIFADGILQHHVPSPLVGSWLSSDRPPLQTGFFLIFSVFSNSNLTYLVTTVGMQVMVVVFVLLYIREFVKEKKYVYLLALLIFFNGFVFVHALFVWPKLLSALYQGIAFYYMHKIWVSKKDLIRNYTFFGISASFAFLAHGGSVFFLLSLGILLLFTIQNKKDIKALSYGLFSSLFLYLPWVLYQKLVDPPGDRLLKWHLAGRNDPTKETFLQVLHDYYENLTLSDWVHTQILHFGRIYDSFYFHFSDYTALTRNHFLDNAFFGLDYALLFYSVILVPLLYIVVKNKLTAYPSWIHLLLWSFILNSVIWSLVLTRGTVIHQGSYFAWFSGLIVVTFIVYHFNRYVFYVLGILNLAIFTYVYLYPYLFQDDWLVSIIVTVMIGLYMTLVNSLIKKENCDIT